jgi:hypothetical protein
MAVVDMTRKQNVFFLKAGAAGFATFFGAAVVNGLISFSGHDNSAFQSVLQAAMPFMVFPAFISLVWFGIMPRAGTMMYLAGMFDNPRYRYMYTWNLYRFVFLVTDNPRVVLKERSGN